MKLSVTTEAVRSIVVAPARAYREFVIDRARDDIAYTSWRARRTYRATWGPRRRHRRLGGAPTNSIRHDLREATPWTC